MSTHDPSGPEPEGGGKPSFDKQPPQPGPGAYGGSYGGDPHANQHDQNPYDQNPYGQNPYDQPSGYGMPGAGPVPGMPPLGTWPRRILARLIDYLLMQAVGAIIVAPFADLSERNGSAGAFWVGALLYLVYEALMLSRDGQTLGKKATKIRVAMLIDGNPPTQSAAWTRAAVFILPAVLCCAALWWLVDGLWGVFDKPYRQCIHDKAAKTVVVTTEV
ncbi:RDD family protein [Streptomyces sp. NRRL WC-3742]|uniref:RDD family protein n=1 Tax=Streptomyces sp. NRRL WC-3742 TaxID=1463934 RepID=UPI0004C8E2AB|nr:RDD family protein [Streptomyces sp. NRRL WC-3742]